MSKQKPILFNLATEEAKTNCIALINGIQVGTDRQVIIREAKEVRSAAQHRLRWLWMAHLEKNRAGIGIGRDRQGWNRFFKGKFMREILIAQDEEFAKYYINADELISGSPDERWAKKVMLNAIKTEWFTVKSMCDYLDVIDKYCINTMQVQLPVPADLEWAKQHG